MQYAVFAVQDTAANNVHVGLVTLGSQNSMHRPAIQFLTCNCLPYILQGADHPAALSQNCSIVFTIHGIQFWHLQVSMMYELMGTKKEDDEFVLQIAHSLLSLLACQATRTVLLQSTQVRHAQPDAMLPFQPTLYQSLQIAAQSICCDWPLVKFMPVLFQGDKTQTAVKQLLKSHSLYVLLRKCQHNVAPFPGAYTSALLLHGVLSFRQEEEEFLFLQWHKDLSQMTNFTTIAATIYSHLVKPSQAEGLDVGRCVK